MHWPMLTSRVASSHTNAAWSVPYYGASKHGASISSKFRAGDQSPTDRRAS